MTLQDRAAEVIARCRRLALCTETEGETTRLFLCPAMQEAHALLRGWMEAAGMTVRVDCIGNLRGLYPGQRADAPRLLIGSHLDTVPNAGAFDGVLGVLLGLALVEELHGERLPFAIELIGFSEEEGVRFGKPFLGSLAFLGELLPETLDLRDRRGITIADAVRSFGLDPANLADALLDPKAFAYLELHIEQGPVLESLDRPLGVVSAIAGQTRLELHFTGQANHAGTTPMALRHDALAAAAVWMVAVEAYARDCHDLVATIGRIVAEPGAVNVVPGSVRATLDVRHADDTVRQTAILALQTAAHAASHARGVTLAVNLLHDQPAVPLDPRLTAILQQAAALAGHEALPMPSGAGHDAMILAPRLPSAMLFLRSPGGLSHHPQEAVLPEDVTAALATGLHFLRLLRP